MWTLGQTGGSEQASALSPKTGFLSFFQTEARSGQGEPQQRYRQMSGHREGTIARRSAEEITKGATYTEVLGYRDGAQQIEEIQRRDTAIRRRLGDRVGGTGGLLQKSVYETDSHTRTDKLGHFDQSFRETQIEKGGEMKWKRTLGETGRLQLSNPEWDVDMKGDSKAVELTNGTTTISVEDDVVTVDTGGSSFTIDGSKIYIGDSADSESQPLALGKKLTQFLKAMKQWANQHTHTHPTGPTGPPITPFARPTTPILSSENFTD